jgi:hypothetical protein
MILDVLNLFIALRAYSIRRASVYSQDPCEHSHAISVECTFRLDKDQATDILKSLILCPGAHYRRFIVSHSPLDQIQGQTWLLCASDCDINQTAIF